MSQHFVCITDKDENKSKLLLDTSYEKISGDDMYHEVIKTYQISCYYNGCDFLKFSKEYSFSCFGIKTKKKFFFKESEKLLKDSRSKRLILFLFTLPPCFLLTAKPALSSLAGKYITGAYFVYRMTLDEKLKSYILGFIEELYLKFLFLKPQSKLSFQIN